MGDTLTNPCKLKSTEITRQQERERETQKMQNGAGISGNPF